MSDTNQVIIHEANGNEWLRFRNPIAVFSTTSPTEVVSILEHIEREVEAKQLYAAGFMAYEAGRAFDPALHFRSGSAFPLLWFGLFEKAEQFVFPETKDAFVWSPVWQSSVTKEEYRKAIQAIKVLIAAGATYQVNYSYRLTAPYDGNALDLFVSLGAERNIPYAAFVESDHYAICSLSPELFFNLDGNEIYSKPMKGTMPRGMLNDDDLLKSQQLYSSEKNRAENIMIVDMVRNDIGRIAMSGSVNVASRYDIEKYDTVWQMTSTVRAQTTASLAQIFQAIFPPASVTGAPKVNTVRIIAELETSPRRIYTGSVGFIAPRRRAQFNVAIRTLLIDKQQAQAEYGVGGGIVWDSVDTAEYDECRTKAKILDRWPAGFCLLETMLWTPAENFFLIDLHLERMKASAAYFSFPFDEHALKHKLSSLVSELPRVAHRVRLLLSRDGLFSCQATPYQAGKDKIEPLVCLAKHPVASDNPFLYHKTTARSFYEQARISRPGYDEVILWNERGEVTEFCTANIVVDLNGEMVTPPVCCGLLPGTYRAWLLQRSMVKEEVIGVESLRRARKIYLCNSVRKMQEVRFELEDAEHRSALQKTKL